MNAGLRESLQAVLEQPILDWLPVSGGCISEASVSYTHLRAHET